MKAIEEKKASSIALKTKIISTIKHLEAKL